MKNTTIVRCNIRFHKYSRNFIYNIILLLFFIGYTTAQTTLINPTGDGGFENGATFTANGWLVTTGAATRNQWTCNTGATAGFSGTRAAYITNNTSATPPPHSYTLDATRVSHLYRTVTIPAGQTTIALSFNWIGVGEGTTLDRLRVWLVPTAFTPTYGTEITTAAPNGSIAAGLPNYNGQATWTAANITIPASYAGTTFRLVFEWRNDNSAGTQPPAAIDNISLVSSIPGPCVAPSAATAFLLGNITTSTFPATFSGSASGYLVVRSLTNTPPTPPVNGTTYSAININNLGGAFSFVQSGASTSIAGTGLASGTQYYYFIYAYNNTGCTGGPVYNTATPLIGSGTTGAIPANDNCSGAIALIVNPTLICTTTTAGTTGNATQSQTGCVGTADDDVWYRFVATATSHIVSVTPTTLLDAVLQVFSGTCAGTLTSLACIDTTIGSNVETTTLTGLSIGTTYFVRVYSYASAINQGTFSICVTTIAPCVAPSQATSFVLGTTTSSSVPANFSGSANGYLVVQSSTNTPPTQPVNGTTYNAGNINTLGAGYTFVQSGASTNILGTGLNGNTRYYYFIYAFNSTACSGGPTYATTGPLTGNGITCPAVPNSVTTTGITTSGFNLNWATPTGGFSGTITYSVQITTDAGYTVNIAGSPFSIIDPSVTLNLTGLSTSTTYYYRILARNGCNSAYVSGNVTTTCTASNIPYTQNFDSVTQPALPTCVAIENTNGDTKFWKTCTSTSLGNATAVLPVSGTNQMGIQYDFTNAMNDWFYLRGLNLNAGTAYRLTFFTRAYTFTGENEILEVKYGNSPSASSMTTALISSLTVIGNTPYIQKTVDFIPSSTGVFYIGFHGVSPADTWYLFVDDVTVTLSPSCLTPNLSDTTNITFNSATINWTAPLITPSNGYQYVVSTSNTTPSGAGTPTAALTANINSLTANTTYYVFVRSNCGGTFSTWTASGVFQTGYCLSSSTSTLYYINNFSTTGGLTNITNNRSGISATGYGNFLALSASQQPYGTVNFSSAYVGGTFGFNIWIDWNNDLDFDDFGEKVYSSGGYFTGNTGSFTVPANAIVGNLRMRIRANFNDINPLACNSITNGETEDYTFTVVALACGGSPNNLSVTNVGLTSATINWSAATPAPASGYNYIVSSSATTPVPATLATGSTAAGITTSNLTGLASGAQYYVWVRSDCGANKGLWVGPISFITNAPPPVTTNASLCPGGNSSLTATGSCTTLTNSANTINGAWDAGGDPRAVRPIIFIDNSPICQFDANGLTANYASIDFQVNVTGFYVLTMAPTTAYDSMGYIVINPFNPGVCGSGTWVVGDDDSGPTDLEPMLSTNLTAGVTYTLISTLYSGSNITLTNTYQWNVTGPGTISVAVGGTVEWYTAASGGLPIGTGTPFNPVGVTGSGLTNTNTPGTYPYYAACPNNPTVRSLANFVINGPTSVISGSGSTCSGSVPMSIAFTGTSPWTFTYTNGITPVTVVGNTTNPYIFNVTPTIPATYTVTALSDATCTSSASSRTGTGTISVSKNWNGATSDWNNASNWNPAGIPTALDCIVIGNTAIDPIISGTSYNAFAYSLTILNGGALQVNSSNTITVTDIINVVSGGQFNIRNSASLVQVNNVANTGIITIERITQPMYRFDYTYWGSPVNASSNFTLGMLSPATLPDKYFSWLPSVSGSFGSWFNESAATVMNPIKGYIVRAPQTFSLSEGTKVPYTANFIGTPNNGDISAPIFRGTLVDSPNDDWNLLGNPYPSALNAESFLSDPANIAIIDGTIYFWTHKSPPSANNVDPFYGDFVINYSANDYASWNRLGGTGTTAAALSGGATPVGFIASGQGFFTKSIGATSGNSVVFKNSMRVNFKNDQFFRNSIVAANNGRATENEKHRIWLNLVSTGGSFNQILVGYHNEATSGLDRDFDGIRFSDNNSITFHSKLTDKNLVIQGRALPFSDQDQVPLGYKSVVNETFSIRIDHIDGLFENQNIYIEDRLMQNIHDLKQSPYVFTSDIGSFDERFVLRYSNGLLGTSSLGNGSEVLAYLKNEKLVIHGGEVLSEVTLYDISGKLILTEVLERPTTNFETAFHGAEGVYFAKIKFQNSKFAIKKLIQKK